MSIVPSRPPGAHIGPFLTLAYSRPWSVGYARCLAHSRPASALRSPHPRGAFVFAPAPRGAALAGFRVF